MTNKEWRNNKEKIEALAARGRKDFYFFMRYILGSSVGFELIQEIPHREMCERVQTWDKRMKLILAPRDTFKTTVCVVGYALWLIINDPDVTILLSADKTATSIQSLLVIQDVIETHPLFRLCYGNLKGDRLWNSTKMVVSTRTSKKRAPTIMATGIGSPKVGFHFDYILFDDPHNEKNISTPEQLHKVNEYRHGLLPVMDTVTGKMQLTATRWHHQDTHSHILDEEKDYWNIFIRSAEYEEDGEIKYYFPSRLTKEFLEERKRSGMSSWFYSCQYQNFPTDDENALFRAKDFQYFIEHERDIIIESELNPLKIRKCDLNFFVLVDPSGRGLLTQQRRLDYTGIVVVGVDYKQQWFIFEAVRKRGMQPSDIINQLVMYHYKYHPMAIGIEAATYFGQIKIELEREFERRGIFQRVKDLFHHNMEKLHRIRGLQPIYNDRRVYHAKGLFDLESELLTWSANSVIHDDLIDPLAYLPDIIIAPESGIVEKVSAIDVTSPNYMITADMAWTREGCRVSFNEFLETWGRKEMEEFERELANEEPVALYA